MKSMRRGGRGVTSVRGRMEDVIQKHEADMI
jgi:hypothetical protein